MSKNSVRPIPAFQTLAEEAVDTIRNRILDLTLQPGTRIDAPLLMQQFKLSRTPAREALNRLAAEGLVVLHANRGAYVHRLDFEDIQALFDIYFVEERMLGHFCNFDDAGLVADLEGIHREHQAASKAHRQPGGASRPARTGTVQPRLRSRHRIDGRGIRGRRARHRGTSRQRAGALLRRIVRRHRRHGLRGPVSGPGALAHGDRLADLHRPGGAHRLCLRPSLVAAGDPNHGRTRVADGPVLASLSTAMRRAPGTISFTSCSHLPARSA